MSLEETLASEATYLSRSDRSALQQVLGGGEAQKMTPGLADHLQVLDEPLSCRMVADKAQMEINLIDRRLDILTAAELPSTGELVPVAIENQFGKADPDHFGRLVGWYMPETEAPMGVLIAEEFDPHLVRAVGEGTVIRPEHGLWLVEACGFLVNGQPAVVFTTVASSLPRADRIRRERAFRMGSAGVSVSHAEATKRTAAVFAFLAQTSKGSLVEALAKSAMTTGPYRWLKESGHTCHVSLSVTSKRISVGSCYLKSATADEQILDALEAANQDLELDPLPDRRALRGVWWDLDRDIGWTAPEAALPPDLGQQIEDKIKVLQPAIDRHQQTLLEVIEQPSV